MQPNSERHLPILCLCLILLSSFASINLLAQGQHPCFYLFQDDICCMCEGAATAMCCKAAHIHLSTTLQSKGAIV